MKRVVYEAFGEPESVLRVEDATPPEPGSGQVRIRTTRAVIHNHDLWTIRGSYGQRPKLPAVGGSEAAGIVEAVGVDVRGLAVGQRVHAFALGTWAEYFSTDATKVIPLPDDITDDAGCQLIAMPLSAMALVDHYVVGEGEWIVQNAANGAVGKVLATIARARKIAVLHLVRSEAAAKELNEAGIEDAIVVTTDPDWKKRARSVLGVGKAAVGIDSVGGRSSGELASLLAPGGRLVAFGSMSGEPISIDSGVLIFKGITVEGFWMTTHRMTREKSKELVDELVGLVRRKELALPVAGVYPISAITSAVSASVQASRHGKVLVSADGDSGL